MTPVANSGMIAGTVSCVKLSVMLEDVDGR